MKSKQDILNNIIKQGMLPLFYHESISVSSKTVRALYRAGIRVIEYTNRGSAALDNFKTLKNIAEQEMPDLALGIGTIKSSVDAVLFIEAGAEFIISPVVKAEVADVVNKADLLWVPGCMTPTEIDIAQQHQAMLIKLFPANILGHEFVSSIKELFPDQLFIPTGGVELDKNNLELWFKAGVCAVGLGSKLISKHLLNNNCYDIIYNQTVTVLKMISEAKLSAGNNK